MNNFATAPDLWLGSRDHYATAPDHASVSRDHFVTAPDHASVSSDHFAAAPEHWSASSDHFATAPEHWSKSMDNGLGYPGNFGWTLKEVCIPLGKERSIRNAFLLPSNLFCTFVTNCFVNGKKINSVRLGDEKNASPHSQLRHP
jgi:hypothetical protein